MKSVLAALIIAVLGVPLAQAKSDYHGLPPPGAAALGAPQAAVCAACHGSNGIGASSVYPNLAGQKFNYILKQLEDFRSGARTNSIMSAMAMTILPSKHHANLKDIAAYFAQLKPMWTYAPAAAPADHAQIELGKSIYQHGVAREGIPSCAACHELGGEGNGPMAIPALAGQHAAYLVAQLKQFASGERHNSPGHVMHMIARKLNAKQEAALAAYLRQLDPATSLGIGPKDFSAYARAVIARHASAGKSPQGTPGARAGKSAH